MSIVSPVDHGPRSRLPEPPAPPEDAAWPRWGIPDAFQALFAALLAAFTITIVWRSQVAASAVDDLSFEGPWLPAIVAVPQVVMLTVVIASVAAKGRGVVADIGASIKAVDLLLGPAYAVLALVLAGITAVIADQFYDADADAAVADLVTDSSQGAGITVWIVLTALAGTTLVPVAEELVFRGLWWGALQKRRLGTTIALVGSSAVFAVFHFEPRRFPVLLALGIGMGLGRLHTGRIGAGIVAHSTINTLGFAVLLDQVATS